MIDDGRPCPSHEGIIFSQLLRQRKAMTLSCRRLGQLG